MHSCIFTVAYLICWFLGKKLFFHYVMIGGDLERFDCFHILRWCVQWESFLKNNHLKGSCRGSRIFLWVPKEHVMKEQNLIRNVRSNRVAFKFALTSFQRKAISSRTLQSFWWKVNWNWNERGLETVVEVDCLAECLISCVLVINMNR